MTDNNLPPERDVKDFGFRQLCKLRVWNDDEVVQTLPASGTVQMLCVSSQFGLTFIAYQQGFKVVKTSDIACIDERHADDRSTAIDETIPIVATVVVASAPAFIGLSCDDLTLVVVTQAEACCPEAHLFDIRVFATQTSPAAFSKVFLSEVPGCRLVDGTWNPSVPNLFATCLSDGSAQLWSIADNMTLLAKLPSQTMATCVCWSPRGKQLIVGKGDGTMCQYDQALAEKKKWPYPAGVLGDDQTQRCKVLNVMWESTFTVISVYIPTDRQGSDQQPYVIVTTIPKDGSVSMINFEDLCYGTGEERAHKYFMYHVAKWEMVVTASANALEAALLAKNPDDKKSWERWNLEESARAEMPLTIDQADTFPIGLAVDFTSQSPIILSADKPSIPPCPMLLLLSTDGVLVPFYMMYMRSGIPTLTSAPHILNPAGIRVSAELSIQGRAADPPKPVSSIHTGEAFNWSLSQFSQNSQTPAAASQLPPIISQSAPIVNSLTSGVGQSTFGQPQDLSRMSQFSNNQQSGAKVQEHFGDMKNKPEPSSRPSTILQTPIKVGTKGFSFTPQTLAGSVPKENALSSTQASVPITAPGMFIPSTPNKPPPVQLLAATTGNIKDTPPHPAATDRRASINQVVDSEFTGSILDEIAHFERELQDLKERNKKVLNLGTKSEQLDLRDRTNQVYGICQQTRDTTKFHHKEISELKTQCLDSMSRVEEVRVRQERNKDGHYHNMLKSRSLDPGSVELMRSLRQHCQCVERTIQNLDVILDEQLDNYQAEKKCKNKSICTPQSDAIYRVLKSNHNLIQSQKTKLDEVQRNLTQLRLHNKTSPWKTGDNSIEPAYHKSLSFISSALESPDSNKMVNTTPRRSHHQHLDPGAQKKLCDFLRKRSVPKVYLTAPTNLSSSKLLLNSPRASLINKSQTSTPNIPGTRSAPFAGRVASVAGNQITKAPVSAIRLASDEISTVAMPVATDMSHGSITRGEAVTSKPKDSAPVTTGSTVTVPSTIKTAEQSALVTDVLPKPDYQTKGSASLSATLAKTGSLLANHLADNSSLIAGADRGNMTTFSFQPSSAPASSISLLSTPGAFFLSDDSSSARLVSKSISTGVTGTSLAQSTQPSMPSANLPQPHTASNGSAGDKVNLSLASKNLFGTTPSVFAASTTQGTLDLTSSQTNAWPPVGTTVTDLSTSNTSTAASKTGFNFNAASSQASGFSFTSAENGFSFSMPSLPNSVKEPTESAPSMASGSILSFTGVAMSSARSAAMTTTTAPPAGFSFNTQFTTPTLTSSASLLPASATSGLFASTKTNDILSDTKEVTSATVITTQASLPDIATSSTVNSSVTTNPSAIKMFSFKPPDNSLPTTTQSFAATSAVTSQQRSVFGGFEAVTSTTRLFNTAATATSITSTAVVTSPATSMGVFENKDKAIAGMEAKQPDSLLGGMLSGTASVAVTTGVVPTSTWSLADSSAGIFGQALQVASTTAVSSTPGSSSNIFGQAAVAGTGFPVSLSASAAVTHVSFSPDKPLFGEPSMGSGSIFGGTSTPAKPATTNSGSSVFGGFGTQSSPFGQTTQAGGGGFLGGLGGKPSSENANKNVFASSLGTPAGSTSASIFGTGGVKSFTSSTLGSAVGQTGGFGSTSVFGSSAGQVAEFGTSVFGTTGSGVAASGFAVGHSPTQTATGFGSPPSFGGSPGFASPAMFGGSPIFGGGGSFGGTNFGSPVAASGEGIFGQGDSQQGGGFASFASTTNTFGSMAAQSNTATFGGLAQGNPSTFGSASPSSFGSSTFGGGAPNTGFGNATFGSSPSFSGYRS